MVERLKVFGGSLGANFFNHNLPSILEKINKKNKLSVIHQSGENMFDFLVQNYKEKNIKAEVKKYIFDMDKKYDWADIVIARSGALTVSELIQIRFMHAKINSLNRYSMFCREIKPSNSIPIHIA